MTEFSLDGVEHRVSSSLVPIGSKLPNFIEVPTSKLLDIFIDLYQKQDISRSKLRTKLNQWLYRRTKPNFYVELHEYLHLAYIGQPNGAGSQHLWRLFFHDRIKQKIETITKSSALVVGGQQPAQNQSTNANADVNPPMEWGGMYFRSGVEIKIAEELDKRGVLFFANARGRISGNGSPISDMTMTGRLEVDFLVFHKGKCISLEVDGKHHQQQGNTERDYVRDRVLLRESIATARFTASDCHKDAESVVTEFLNLF